MAANDQEIWVSAFDVLIAQLDEALIELRRSLASVAIEHGVDSPQVAGVRAQIDEATAKREKAQAERQRVMAQLAAGVSVAVTTEKPKATPKRKQPGILTQSDLKLIEASAEIMSTPPDGEDMAFTHSVLCQVGLPRSKFDGREFMRQSGAAWINVQAGWLVTGCATNECHGGTEAGRLMLVNRKARSEASTYTNFLIMERFRLDDGTPLLNYDDPAKSPLLQMALPRPDSVHPHPEVPRGIKGNDVWRPLFRNQQERLFERSVDWLKAMYQPRPEYPIEYRPPRPSEAPALEKKEPVDR